MTPKPWSELTEWLNTQWGPGSRYPDKLDLARAIGSKAALDQIKRNGVTTIKMARAVARATGVSMVFVLVKASVITAEDLQEFCPAPLDPEEVLWLARLRRLRENRPDLLAMLLPALAVADRLSRQRDREALATLRDVGH